MREFAKVGLEWDKAWEWQGAGLKKNVDFDFSKIVKCIRQNFWKDDVIRLAYVIECIQSSKFRGFFLGFWSFEGDPFFSQSRSTFDDWSGDGSLNVMPENGKNCYTIFSEQVSGECPKRKPDLPLAKATCKAFFVVVRRLSIANLTTASTKCISWFEHLIEKPLSPNAVCIP